jgi:2-polyprenyl-3-methyl-5-hydroxy-6-metoxy-1,4-benzoquinol methylase
MSMSCRFCATPLTDTVADLGMSPMANSYVPMESAGSKEPFYPLHAFVCPKCFLVQLDEFESPEAIFGDYLYFSSFSDSWLAHCKEYTRTVRARFAVGPNSKVVEVASNDGYLLQYFMEAGVPVLGVEPAENVAKSAIQKGVPTEVAFFGAKTAKRLMETGHDADLTVANNVLAHVPDINDFVSGFAILLKPEGVSTFEFPHLLNLLQLRQFDTIYHEHFSYLSAVTVSKILEHHGMRIFDVEELPTHGGSLRIYACLKSASHARSPRVDALLAK